jgi:hypothetical protein
VRRPKQTAVYVGSDASTAMPLDVNAKADCGLLSDICIHISDTPWVLGGRARVQPEKSSAIRERGRKSPLAAVSSQLRIPSLTPSQSPKSKSRSSLASIAGTVRGVPDPASDAGILKES